MTDYAGTEEPAHKDDDALEEPAPIIPIGPGTAGVVAVPVTKVTGDPDSGSLDGEPLGWAEDDEPVEHHGGVGDAIRGLLRRDKGR